MMSKLEIKVVKVENGYTLEIYADYGFETYVFTNKKDLISKLVELLNGED